MGNIDEFSDLPFAAYSHALVALVLLALIALILSPMAALARGRAGVQPGDLPPADYSSKDYRICRAYLNATEMMGMFAAVIVAAVLTGAPAFWVNLFASLAVIGRVIMVYVHIQGIGSSEPGPRSILFVFSWAMAVLIALMALLSGVT